MPQATLGPPFHRSGLHRPVLVLLTLCIAPHASRRLAQVTVPGLLDTFVDANKGLDEIQKSLNDYLEVKCAAFPRFYFLSNGVPLCRRHPPPVVLHC